MKEPYQIHGSNMNKKPGCQIFKKKKTVGHQCKLYIPHPTFVMETEHRLKIDGYTVKNSTDPTFTTLAGICNQLRMLLATSITGRQQVSDYYQYLPCRKKNKNRSSFALIETKGVQYFRIAQSTKIVSPITVSRNYKILN